MKLLILTQKVDKNDTVLGFFHSWIMEFAKHCENVTVVALGVGEYDLPDNVRAFSLGKESGDSRLKYLWNFYRFILRERNNYDHVFVHMNQEYVLLGGVIWRMLGKRLFLWRNHPQGGYFTDMAVLFSDLVYATSPYSYVKKYHSEKTILMPVGIDTSVFEADAVTTRDTRAILFFGRISPIKRIDLFLNSLVVLKDRGVSCTVHIIGDPHNPGDDTYLASLSDFIKAKGLTEMVKILPGVPNNETPAMYRKYGIVVNMTDVGSFDKTIIEAMSSGMLVLTTNIALRGEIPDMFIADNVDAIHVADKIQALLALPSSEHLALSRTLRDYVIQKHSLNMLMKNFFAQSVLCEMKISKK
jgi:glycosyltransferase involved in cell wall biosynthesis